VVQLVLKPPLPQLNPLFPPIQTLKNRVSTTAFVAHGVTARPDVHPTFYSPLPAAFATGCDWLRASLVPGGLAQFDAIFEHGVEAGRGWAEQNGYCA
jgi:hypothetical protein